MSGKVLLVHGGTETDETGLGLISTRVWVVNEADKEQVVISASFDKETHTYHLEVRSLFVCFVLFVCVVVFAFGESTRSIEWKRVKQGSWEESAGNKRKLLAKS